MSNVLNDPDCGFERPGGFAAWDVTYNERIGVSKSRGEYQVFLSGVNFGVIQRTATKEQVQQFIQLLQKMVED